MHWVRLMSSQGSFQLARCLFFIIIHQKVVFVFAVDFKINPLGRHYESTVAILWSSHFRILLSIQCFGAWSIKLFLTHDDPDVNNELQSQHLDRIFPSRQDMPSILFGQSYCKISSLSMEKFLSKSHVSAICSCISPHSQTVSKRVSAQMHFRCHFVAHDWILDDYPPNRQRPEISFSNSCFPPPSAYPHSSAIFCLISQLHRSASVPSCASLVI